MTRGRWIALILILVLATTVLASAQETKHVENGYLALYYHAVRLEEHFPQLQPIKTAIYEFGEAVKAPFESSEALFMLGLLHQATGEASKALDYYQRVYQSEPEEHWLLVLIGDLKQELGQVEEAKVAYERALGFEPYSRAYFGLGELLLAGGDYLAAVHAFENAIKDAPEFFHARIGLGKAFYHSENLEKAQETLEYVQLYSPRSAEAHYYLGLVYKSQGLVEKAEHAFERAHQLDERF